MDIRLLLPAAPARPARRLGNSDVEEVLDRLFAPSSIDAGQVPMNARSRIDTGEMRLALAVLEDALRLVLRHHDSHVAEQRLAAREAMDWICSEDDSPPFTFVRVCQLFDLDPDWIRETMHRHLFRAPTRDHADCRTRHAA